MKLAITYTAKTDELEEELAQDARQLLGDGLEIATYQDLPALKEANAAGYVSAAPAARYAGLILQAIADGADAVLSTCCFMGDLVRTLQPFADFSGVSLLSIDEGMCRNAVEQCARVVLLYTAPVAGNSVGHTVEHVEQLLRRHAEVTAIQATDVADLSRDALASRFADVVAEAMDEADGLILAQPSMAATAPAMREILGKSVFCATDTPFAGLRK